VSKSIDRSIQEKIRTGRPRAVLEAMKNADKFIAKLFDTTKRSMVGVPIEGALNWAGVPMGYGISTAIAFSAGSTAKRDTVKMLTDVMNSPQFIKMIEEGGTAQEAEAAQALANSRPFKAFMNTVGLPADDATSFILRTFQPIREGIQAPDIENIPEDEPLSPPQARVQPPAPPTRGVPGMGGQPTPAPGPVAQGPQVASQSSREMLKSLFPFDTTIA